ncbi:MAG: right-handed parallel beta-helix repeat-containing protein [Bacteroidota bacterium]
MKISTLLIFCFFTTCLSAQIIFVKAGSNGNGSSWSDAFGDLAEALDYAQFGDQVWVAAGTYLPTEQHDRYAHFEVSDGVKLYGGFSGNETDLSQRNWASNKTVLSGEIGSIATTDDNSYTVLYTSGVSRSTLVDGFTITKGSANGLGEKGDVRRCGGAWFNDGAAGKSNPTITNCTFINNYGRDGGAIYNYAKEGVCNPRIVNCQFINNSADLDGGAIYNDSSMGICNPVIKDCRISGNKATYGGGILNYGKDGGEASPTITGCSFEDNIGYIRGGSIYSSENNGKCSPAITSSYFSDNKATVGREMYQKSEGGQVVSKGFVKKM